MDLRTVAIVAFAFGVFLHACVAISILDGGNSALNGSDRQPVAPAATQVPRTPNPEGLPDRVSCDEIRGTDYRSAAERQFFLTNCVGAMIPAPSVSEQRAALVPR
jgi:hypothetical protein